MQRNTNISMTLMTVTLLISGMLLQPVNAADSTARSAMMSINVQCKSVTNNVCNIDQTYDSSTKTCRASITPNGIIASERALFQDKSNSKNKKAQSLLSYGFPMENIDSYNGTDVYGLSIRVTGNPGGKRFDVTKNENSGLLVELLEENRGVNLVYSGVNGAKGKVGLLTSSDGQKYNKNCKQEIQGNKSGVNVNAILNGVIGSCASPSSKDTSSSNDNAGADVVTWSSEAIPLAPGNYLITASATLKNMFDDSDEMMILASKSIHVNDNKTCEKVNPPPVEVVEQPEPVDFSEQPVPSTDFNDPATSGDSGFSF